MQKQKNNIPVFYLEKLSGKTGSPDVFFNDHQISNSELMINKPYRSNYYGLGICVAGKATLKTNLDSFEIEKNCIIAISPPIIKQWVKMSANYKTFAVFFTRDFWVKNNANKFLLDDFPFFEANAQHVLPIKKHQVDKILPVILDIGKRLASAHAYKIEIVRSLLGIVLFEAAAVYNDTHLPLSHKQTRSEQLVIEFKKLVCLHFHKEHSVSFYAKLLFITPKHLTETVKQETGRSAKEWIDELIILEAKVLLQDPSLTITAIADSLNFTDQSVFGKFFKNSTGLSPLMYRQKN